MNSCVSKAVLRACLLAVLLTSFSQARDWKALKPQGYVSDFANVIDANNKATLEAYCGRIEQATGAQMAFVTVEGLDGESIEDVANDIYQAFGIGKKGKDNGVLLLLVSGDRRFRLEIGNGLEGILPDGMDGQILLEMRPELRAGQYGQALLYAAQRVGSVIAQDKGVTIPGALPRRPQVRESPGTSIPWPFILGAIALFFLFTRGGGRGGGGNFLTGMLMGGMMRGGDGGRNYGGFGGSDGGGGGFGGFGGGSSGGGGASSDW